MRASGAAACARLLIRPLVPDPGPHLWRHCRCGMQEELEEFEFQARPGGRQATCSAVGPPRAVQVRHVASTRLEGAAEADRR